MRQELIEQTADRLRYDHWVRADLMTHQELRYAQGVIDDEEHEAEHGCMLMRQDLIEKAVHALREDWSLCDWDELTRHELAYARGVVEDAAEEDEQGLE